MKLTIFLLSICSFAFGQSPKKKGLYSNAVSSKSPISLTTGTSIRDGSDESKFYFDLSKGELLTIKQHEEDLKQNSPIIKQFFKRDSVYNYMFLNNTISPYINKGDTLESWKIVGEKIELKFKPKKK